MAHPFHHHHGQCLRASMLKGACRLTHLIEGSRAWLRQNACQRAMKTMAKTSLIEETRQSMQNNSMTAVEITQMYLDRIERTEPQIHSFVTVTSEQALRDAERLDSQRKSGEALGPLAGIPIAVKDTICTKGINTTAGSPVLEGYVPPYDASAVSKLRAAGAIIVGKANCDQFAMGSTTENSAFEKTRNPWDLERVPGGSSGGSASSVAAGQCVASLGSDTGGSIRQPAHFCGVVGLKPTYGRVSRYGLMAYGSSLDCIGPLTNSVRDAATMLSVISGHDLQDATSSINKAPDFMAGLDSKNPASHLKGKNIAVVSQTLGEGVSDSVNTAIDNAISHFASLGAAVEKVSVPAFDFGLPAYYTLAFSEASSNLSRYDGMRYGLCKEEDGLRSTYGATREGGLGAEVKRRILMGTYALSAGYYDAYYQKAQQVRHLIQRQLAEVLEKYDAILGPVAPYSALKIGEVVDDPIAMYKGDIMTVNVNLAGLPAISLPCGQESTDKGSLPIGMQLTGRAFEEAHILQLAYAFEQTFPLSLGHPVLS